MLLAELGQQLHEHSFCMMGPVELHGQAKTRHCKSMGCFNVGHWQKCGKRDYSYEFEVVASACRALLAPLPALDSL